MELSSIYKTLHWHHQQRDREPNESVGLFIILPQEIAEQFPATGKEGEDSSPPHVTLFYIGEVAPQFEERIIEVCKQVCENFKRFKLKLKKPTYFTNDKEQIIYHSPVASNKLILLNSQLKQAFQLAQIPFSNKWPEFKPHITIAYCESKEEYEKFRDVKPSGEWVVEHIWLWRLTRTATFLS